MRLESVPNIAPAVETQDDTKRQNIILALHQAFGVPHTIVERVVAQTLLEAHMEGVPAGQNEIDWLVAKAKRHMVEELEILGIKSLLSKPSDA